MILKDNFVALLEKSNSNVINNKYTEYINSLPNNLENIQNFILYGPSGTGKYSEALKIIEKYSPSYLKYEKKMIINSSKNEHIIKISDIHYEIDVMLLGCNAKLLWHEIYNHIVDSFISKNQEIAYIVLKNFHKINNELLDIFNTYMQLDIINYTNIKYIIITESINFLSDNIFNRYKLINLERPTKSSYVKILGYKLDKNDDINNITNIQDIKKKSFNMESSYKFKNLDINKNIAQEIIDLIKNKKDFGFLKLRELLYEICIFEVNVEILIFNIIKELKNENLLNDKDINNILIENYKFLLLYNNNYRPIYHLEKIILYISVLLWK